MTDIIFAQTRFDYRNPENGYGSYHDFWRLVDQSGFSSCYVDEIDAQDASKCYIFAPVNGEIKNGDTFTGWPEAKAKIIFWNLEQGDYGPIPGVSEVWASDATFAQRIGGRYVLMGSHPGLMNYPPLSRSHQYDTIMLACMTPRREQVRVWLKERDMTVAPNGWYEERHARLCQSSAMLHVHQNDKRYLAPQRWALAAAYKLPLVSETLDNRGEFQYSQMLTSDYQQLPDFLELWIRRNGVDALRDYAYALHQYLCFDRPFAREVMRNV